MKSQSLIDTGVEVGELAHSVPFQIGVAKIRFLELGAQGYQRGGMGEETVPHVPQDQAHGVGAGCYVGEGPGCHCLGRHRRI